MKQPDAAARVEFARERGRGFHAFQQLDLAGMAVAARAHFVGDAADRDQRGLVFLLRDVGSRALNAAYALLGGEFAQGAVDRHARDAELASERGFGGDLVAFLPFTRMDALQDVILDPLERRNPPGAGPGFRCRLAPATHHAPCSGGC